MEYLYFIISLIILIKSADFFVDSAISIAKVFRVSEIIIGATIVSIGTTLPEIMVSSTSAIKGLSGIAFGNALGSIICNTSLISSLSLIFARNSINRKDIRIPMYFFFASYVLYAIVAVTFGRFNRIFGLILVSIFVLYVFILAKTTTSVKMNEKENKIDREVSNFSSLLKHFCTLVVSATFIAVSSNLLVDNGCKIARNFGVSEATIGITMIALGTSLPELTTCITSIIKKHSNLSLGNIIGANLFNILLVSGISASISPFIVPKEREIIGINSAYVIDLPVAFIVMLILCLPSYISKKTMRWQGIILLSIYFVFLVYNFA